MRRVVHNRLQLDAEKIHWQILHYCFSSSALTLLVGRQERHPACKKTGSWFVGGDDLTGALHILQLQLSPLTTSIILSSDKIQNGDVLIQDHLENGR